MTERQSSQTKTANFEGIWQVQDAQVVSGRIPGYVAAVRIGEQSQVHTGGRTGIETDSAPMAEDTLFRIASLTKPIGGAPVMSLVQDGVLTLDDPIARWLPEAASPRVLVDANGRLDATTAVQQPITVRHLLSFTAGWGCALQDCPLQAEMFARGVFPDR